MIKRFHHVTVLLRETIDFLKVKPDGIYVDATVGGAGHSEYLLSKLGDRGRLYAFDRDRYAIASSKKRLCSYYECGKITFIKDDFRNLKVRLAEFGVSEIDGVCYDLGVSSPQIDAVDRGFSYKKQAPLDMRMDQDDQLTAYEIVNTYSYPDLVKIFFKYGEERFSKQIARKIEEVRERKFIETTSELVEIIKWAKPAKELRRKGHPAKQVFQAIRMEVNDELEALRTSISQSIDLLAVGGRISVVTFHSLEDRLIKGIFRESSRVNVPRDLPFIPDRFRPRLELVTRKPILPQKEELEANSRAHSAKLRVACKINK